VPFWLDVGQALEINSILGEGELDAMDRPLYCFLVEENIIGFEAAVKLGWACPSA
jgi:hypothetical protein